MNSVTFNKDFEIAIAAITKTHQKADQVRQALLNFLQTPLIMVDDPISENWQRSDAPMAFDRFGMPLFPFSSFRASINTEYGFDLIQPDQTRDKTTGSLNADILVCGSNAASSSGRRFNIIIKVRRFTIGNTEIRSRQGTMIYAHFQNDIKISTGGWKAEIWGISLKKQKVLRPEEITIDGNKIFKIIVDRVYEALHKLAIDFFNPNIYLVKVSQSCKEPRSTEWHQAREHYIFVHKNSPINKVGATGNVFHPDAEIKRSAHSRRAHYRLLKHPRYKSKRGSLVLVKSAWVGPKEWSDASGQIYKIIENPAQTQNQKAALN